jgi:hypothetical protein
MAPVVSAADMGGGGGGGGFTADGLPLLLIHRSKPTMIAMAARAPMIR